jgi:hypothetical protein
MRDGRLAGAERASFERHVARCAACAEEVRALEALAGALRVSPRASADELHVRRERMRLLAAFDRSLVAPERRTSLPWPWVAALVTAACVIGVLWPRPRPVSNATALIQAEEGASWSDRVEGQREIVALDRGGLRVRVLHGAGQRPLSVELPDGELEDTGTTFFVSVDAGRTTSVTVEEGSVLLHLRGRAPVALGAGEAWSPEGPRSARSGGAGPGEAGPAPSSPLDGPPAPSAPAGSGVRHLRAASSPAPPAAASEDFRAAMDTLDRGDPSGAAGRFERFVEAHPRDPRAEDAAYLRVIALQRIGDSARMREAAGEYLRRYPAGFRRAEVQGLARLP